MRDWKLENLTNDQEISTVPFGMEKEDYLCSRCTVSTIFYNRFSGKLRWLPFSKKNPETSVESEMEHDFFGGKPVWKM